MIEVEEAAFDDPWAKWEFAQRLADVINSDPTKGQFTGLVALCDKVLVGYSMATVFKRRVVIDRIAVAPPHQRYGIASRLVTEVKMSMRCSGPNRIEAFCREDTMGPIRFFAKLDFRGVAVLKTESPGPDIYKMAYDYRCQPCDIDEVAARLFHD